MLYRHLFRHIHCLSVAADIFRSEYVRRHMTTRSTRPGAEVGLGELIEVFEVEVLERHVRGGKDEDENEQ